MGGQGSGGARKGAGRPAGSTTTELTATLSIKCTPEQRERWKAQAKREGVSLAKWVRRRLGGLLVLLLLVGCMPPAPDNAIVEPPPGEQEAIALSIELVSLLADYRLPLRPPQITWHEGPCLEPDGGVGGCVDGLYLRANFHVSEIHLVRYPDRYGALPHELLHWALDLRDDDPGSQHTEPEWEHIGAIEVVVNGLHPER